ncbi:MAG: protein translocase subunit SecD [Planctomycetes bacterium]|nr:protein translocase subunit SecD [Planctomycetota bacterium]MCB9934880.1 protein translocase subunit SecD [Planctomycetota bacterium]
MWDFIKRWHPIIFLVLGIYLAIPKPAPNPAEIDEEFLGLYDKNDNGVVDKDEFEGSDIDFKLRDRNDDNVLTVGSRFRWPLHDYKWNLGQDLKGGSSLRYVLIQQDMDEAEAKIRELLEPLKDNLDRLSPEARDKFGNVIQGEALAVDIWTTEDFQLLANVAGLFDEGRADALRRYYETWNAAKQRKEDKNLVGPTIETLNRRLGTTGITELNIAPLGENRIEVKLPEFSTPAETARYKQLLETTGKLEMRVLAPEEGDFARLNVNEYPKDEGYKYKWLELARDEVSSALVKELNGRKYVPVQVIDDYDISGRNLDNIQPTTDQQGRMAVSFDLKGTAVARFEALTSKHKKAAAGGEDPRLLAIIIDEKVYSAYSIEDTISGSVQLSGNFSTQERNDIINVLKSGSLNVKLQLEGEESVGPSEGAEAVKRGLWSLLIGAIAVFIVALLVYRGLGLLTIFNLIMVVILVMGAMAAGLGTLTMPGIAGIVLTIGMAIDANILINERIREERERNQNMRGAAEEGFRNALSAIVDSNVTTLLTALILFKVGSGPIQGFALTLAIGIVATLYTALAAYKAMVMGILNVKRDAQFNMAGLKFARDRKINWLKWMGPGAIAAVVLVVSGGSFMVLHGSEVLGIEFRGGHTFRIQMKQGYERDEIAALLVDESSGEAKHDWAKDVEIQPVFRLGSDLEAGKADRFDFRFPMRTEWESEDPEEVTRMLRGELEKVYAEQMVQEGWTARTTDVKQVTLRAVIKMMLKNPDKFREENPEDYDQLWLAKDRAWKGDVNAPRANRARWFGTLAATDNDVVGDFTSNAAGDRQTYTLNLTNVAVTDEADLARKRQEFEDAVRKNFLNDSQTVDPDGDPKIEYFATQAKLSIHVVLLGKVAVKDFTETVRAVKDGPLAGEILEIKPVNPDAEMTNEFDISSSGAMTFSPDPEDPANFSRVEGAVNTAIAQWLKNATPEGNEISRRFLLSSAIGATVAAESQWRALFAIVAALVVVVIYIRIRFASVAWGLAAVVALLHDSFVVVGLIGLADFMGADIKIDLTVVAAILTVIGYSLNDTIINFDRIRENLQRDRLATGGKTPLKEIINTSINQMLSRTVMTSGTTALTTVAMLALGGPLLKGFAFAMTAGIVVGTFSSIYIAGPILLLFDRRGTSLMDLTEEEQQAEKPAADEPEAEQPEEEESESEQAEEKTEEKAEEKTEEKKDEDKKD